MNIEKEEKRKKTMDESIKEIDNAISKLEKAIIHYPIAPTPTELISDALASLRIARTFIQVDLAKLWEKLKELEYIELEELLEFESLDTLLITPDCLKHKFCPDCGYKEPDGHWKDCKLGILLDEYKC